MGWKKWLKKRNQTAFECACPVCGKDIRYPFNLREADARDEGSMVCGCGHGTGIKIVREDGKVRLEIRDVDGSKQLT